jgi:hypothetical protein
MKKLVIAAFGAVSLLSAPAFAQSGSTSTTTSPSGTSGTSVVASQDTVAQMRQKIMHDLQQDGFTNIHVAANSFMVHAENKQGEPVVMILNPDSMFSMTEVGKTASNGNATTEGTNGGNDSLGHAAGSNGSSSESTTK